MEIQFDNYLLTDDRAAVDEDKVCQLLSSTYWATDRPEASIRKSFDHSICISVLHNGQQAGFARIVTDQSTFAWIADVIIDENHRGKGIGKQIMAFIQSYPAIQGCRQMLRTRDAHGLYRQFGFELSECMWK